MTEPRPIQHLRTLREAIPEVWRHVDALRAQRGKGLPYWPDWCYLPMAGGYAIVSGGGDNRVPPERAHLISAVAGLAAWRVTQGIYRYDPSLREALLATDLSRGIPRGALYQLPAWCVWVEDEYAWPSAPMGHRGFFAHLEHDQATHRAELRLLLDVDPPGPFGSLVPVGIHLISDDLQECIEAFLVEARRHGQGGASVNTLRVLTAPVIERAVKLLLYLCSEGPDIYSDSPQARAGRPKPVKIKGGEKLFPPTHPSVWETGFRLGRMIREYEAREHQGGTVRPHLRKAHWHTFLRGPRDGERQRVVRWLPPIPVNVDDTSEINPTIYKIKE